MIGLTLAMIVRDEEDSIGRLIESARPLISRAVIVDTGSTDGTEKAARDALGDIPVEWHERPWVNFGHNRTELMEIVRESTNGGHLLLLDANDEVVVEGPLPKLEADAYNVRYLGGTEWYLPRIVKAALPWRFVGAAHAYLKCDNPIRQEQLDVVALRHHADKPRREKFERDAALLMEAVIKDPSDARSWFYLAQSHRDLGNIDQAISAYKRRAELGGWAEEHYMALYEAGCLLCRHRSFNEGAPLLLEAARLRPTRAEALRALSRSAANVADKIPFPKNDRLFVRPSAYKTARRSKWDEWRATYGTRTFEQEREFYRSVYADFPDQSRYDAAALRRMLFRVPGRFSVIELGGWDGALAAEILSESPAVTTWTNFEVSDDAVEHPVCRDDRYLSITGTDWYWTRKHAGDVFVASHVIEHLSFTHLRATFEATDATWLFLQAPLKDGPTDWTGYQGTHILEVGWDGVHDLLTSLGYERLDDLTAPQVRCYRKTV